MTLNKIADGPRECQGAITPLHLDIEGDGVMNTGGGARGRVVSGLAPNIDRTTGAPQFRDGARIVNVVVRGGIGLESIFSRGGCGSEMITYRDLEHQVGVRKVVDRSPSEKCVHDAYDSMAPSCWEILVVNAARGRCRHC